MNSARKPAVIARSLGPNGSRAPGDTDGNTTNTRSTKNRVSTGTLPYQITMYCDQKKYIQRMDIANWSLATSWTAAGGIEARPRALARMVKIDRRQNAV